MISHRSVQQFVLINGFVLTCASLHHGWGPCFLGSFLKLALLYSFVTWATRNKPFLQKPANQGFPFLHFLSGVVIDFGSYTLLDYFASPTISLLLMAPTLFAFDLVFDFFHYWTHRICHHPFLYKHVHKTHHAVYPIEASVTFQHHPLDLLITNTLPLLISIQIIPMDAYTLTVMFWYKSMQEIGGHTGKELKGSSFIPFVWIPRLLGIALTSRDHEVHHRLPGWNFSKRFSLWDRVFGTFFPTQKSLQSS